MVSVTRWEQFCAQVGIRVPIVQDGMGPAPTTALAIAVSDAGGLGSVSTPSLTGPPSANIDALRSAISEVSASTSGVFAVNVPVGRLASGEMLPASEACIRTALEAKRAGEAERLAVITTSAGFAGDFSRRIHDAGLLHFAKVGSVRHAVKAAMNGADVIIASGFEMGGHTHSTPIGTMVLVPAAVAAVDVPVLASGGIVNGAGLAAALAMGASGIAMGTRFIATVEHQWHDNYKNAVVAATEGSDVLYHGVYAPVRALRNYAVDVLLPRATEELSADELNHWKEERIRLAERDGDVVNGLMPAGQGTSMVTSVVSVRQLLDDLIRDALDRLRSAVPGKTSISS